MSGFFHALKELPNFIESENNAISDCPVMSGFFHALIASVDLNPGQILPATRKDGTGDCPVMSGFFHSLLNN